MLSVTLLPLLDDNYTFLLHVSEQEVVIIDPADGSPIIAYLEAHHLTPAMILNTHHHGDHTGGNTALYARYNCPVLGPEKERTKIPSLTRTLKEGDILFLGPAQEPLHVIETPGHTLGALCFHLPESKILFTGDTLFSAGCGRLFEGTAEQMWHSHRRLLALPDDTQIYCGHEYTLTNIRFGLTIEPDNLDLKAYEREALTCRAEGRPTIPTTLALEKKINVLLRADSPERFAQRRALRNTF